MTAKKMNKASKKIILAAKSQALVQFHSERKHTLKFNLCLACRAAKAFFEWEFHFFPSIKPKKIITTSEMKKIMVKKQAEITADVTSFMKQEEDLWEQNENGPD